MAIHDMAKMTVSGTPGTGTITLGTAVSGFQTFAAAGATNGETVSYSISDLNNAWEIGHGTYTSAGTTLTRGPLFSSNANAAITATSSAVVWVTALAEDITNTSLFTAGTLPVARGGTGVTTSTGTTSVVLSTSPTIATPTITSPSISGGTLTSPTITTPTITSPSMSNAVASGTFTIVGNYIFLNNSTGTVNSTGGPFVYGDAGSVALHLGPSNANFLFQNSSGTNVGTLSAAGQLNITGAFKNAVQANQFGSPSGSATSPTHTNTNILLYDNSATNWAGIGSDTAGTIYFVTGTTAPSTRFKIDPSGNLITNFTTGYIRSDGNGTLSSKIPATATISVANPTGTTSLAGVMVGFSAGVSTITPTTSGRILITICGDATNNTAGDGGELIICYGVGTGPANGAGAPGGLVSTGAATFFQNQGTGIANTGFPYSVTAVVTGLLVGTAYWVDGLQAVLGGGTAAFHNNIVTVVEL